MPLKIRSQSTRRWLFVALKRKGGNCWNSPLLFIEMLSWSVSMIHCLLFTISFAAALSKGRITRSRFEFCALCICSVIAKLHCQQSTFYHPYYCTGSTTRVSSRRCWTNKRMREKIFPIVHIWVKWVDWTEVLRIRMDSYANSKYGGLRIKKRYQSPFASPSVAFLVINFLSCEI